MPRNSRNRSKSRNPQRNNNGGGQNRQRSQRRQPRGRSTNRGGNSFRPNRSLSAPARSKSLRNVATVNFNVSGREESFTPTKMKALVSRFMQQNPNLTNAQYKEIFKDLPDQFKPQSRVQEPLIDIDVHSRTLQVGDKSGKFSMHFTAGAQFKPKSQLTAHEFKSLMQDAVSDMSDVVAALTASLEENVRIATDSHKPSKFIVNLNTAEPTGLIASGAVVLNDRARMYYDGNPFAKESVVGVTTSQSTE